MNLKNIADLSYWFYQPFIAVGSAKWIFIIGFLTITFIGLVSYLVRAFNKQLDKGTMEVLRRSGNWLVVSGLLGLLWLFFRQQRVAFLAWRFWLILWLVMFVFWGYKVIFYALKRMPVINSEQAARELKKKYLPKK